MPNSNSPNRVDFKTKQAEFAAYIRDPEHNPIPSDVQEPRMRMYRELFFNNIETFLSGNFPVLRQLLDDDQWLELTQDFFATHACESPHFSEIPEEFLNYLENERKCTTDLPFLLELAHYEWVEMALSIAKEELHTALSAQDVLKNTPLSVSPLAWHLVYEYPVHKISPHHIPLETPTQPTFLIVYRDPNDEVHFIEITGMTYRLLEIIQAHETCLAETCLKQVTEEMQHPNTEIVFAGGLQILQDLVKKTILIASTH